MADESRDIPVSDLVEPRLLLRPVNKESVDYLELRDSVQERGFLNSICVRPAPHTPGKYEVVDGNYRYHIALDLRLASLPCIIKYGLSDDDVLALQVQANAIRPETTPTDFARQLKKIMSHRPGITFAELAHIVKKRPSWLRDMLGLLDLSETLQKAVDRGEIPLTSAYMLAKIPEQFRRQFVDQAQTLQASEFRLIAAAFIKQYTEAVRQGKLEALFVADFIPVAYVRKLRELEDELKHKRCGALRVAASRCKTPVEGWYLALEWALHLDSESIEQQRHAAMSRMHKRWLEKNTGQDNPPA
jgi:ParB/RepB/Spo0J family partition protein